nr:reverse transcriptase domain-containing protein [Tanacetum cinerariifolium]
MIFHIDSAMKHYYSNDDTCFNIDVINEILEEDFDALLDERSEIIRSIKGTILEEKLFVEFDEFMAMTADEKSKSESKSDTEEPPFEKITFNTYYKIKTSLEEPPTNQEYSQWVERFMNYLKEQTDGEAMINLIKNGDQQLPRVTQVSIAGTSSTEQPPLKDKSIELLLDTYIQYLQVINDLKKCGYSKDKCELNFKFLDNLQPEWKQYATMMRQNKNLMDINIDAIYNILKKNQGDVNDAMGSKKKTVVVTSDPLALIAEKTKVSKSKEKVVVSSDSEGSDANDFSELKKITALLAKALIEEKFVKNDNKKVEKKDDEKKRDMIIVKCYNYKKEGHFAKDCKKVKVKDYEYYKTKMLLAKKDKDEQVLLAKDQAL